MNMDILQISPATAAAQSNWEGVQLVPEKDDYWSDSCCSLHGDRSCTDNDYDEDDEEESDTSTGESTSEADTDENPEDEDSDPEIMPEEVIPIAFHPTPTWEQLSSECVRQQIRELDDPRSQKEFYHKLGQVCSGLVETIKRQRVG